jgi:molybdate transport system regulatory protein
MAFSAPRITSALSLQRAGKQLASPRWMALLAQIGKTRSISAAAKVVGLSYKAAWDAIESMNNLASAPLVQRTTGGKGGGGTVLTKAGAQLVATYRLVAEENERFLKRINTRAGQPARELDLIGRIGMLTSARNHFLGVVRHISRGAVNVEVQLELAGGERLVAVITRGSLKILGLKRGSVAVALIKASWIILARRGADPPKWSARNCLSGTVSRLHRGAVNVEVIVALKGGATVVAVITREPLGHLALARGQQVDAIFKASSVILAVAG